MWSLNQANGYLVNLKLYQGARANADNEDSLNVGEAATPLIRMIQLFPPHVLNLPFRIYFDNLFTDMNLLNYLKSSLQFGGTETIRQNRIPRSFPIMDSNELKKKPRGTFNHACNGEVIVVKWKDNQVVSIASSVHGIEPVSSAGRYS